jgi:hypothetical protein
MPAKSFITLGPEHVGVQLFLQRQQKIILFPNFPDQPVPLNDLRHSEILSFHVMVQNKTRGPML